MQFGRIIGVTALLAALGGLTGALGGALIALGYVLVTEGSVNVGLLGVILRTAGVVGFGVGVVGGPLLSWTLLRKAPIWRAIGETALAAGLAAGVSMAFKVGVWPMIGWSVLGATVAALRLRRASRSSPPAPTP
jgi:hypothetical protein